MAPKRPPEAESGNTPEARGATRQRAPRSGESSRDDISFMEEVVRELAAQNEQARSDSPPEPATLDFPPASAERPRTVRVERDSGFRTPEGISSARAYLPARTLSPGRSETIETETVQVNDPRKLPTMRVARARRQVGAPEGSGRGPRTSSPGDEPERDSLPEDSLLRDSLSGDSAPTLRSAPGVAVKPQRPLGPWIAGLILLAVTGAFVVAVASRGWTLRSLGGSAVSSPGPQVKAEEPLKEALPVVQGSAPGEAKPAADVGAPTALPSSTALPKAPSTPRQGNGSDRWF
jgi:hypothetical protein